MKTDPVVHEIRHQVIHHRRGASIRVHGIVQAGGHLLPLHYTVEHDADPSVHERMLHELHEKGEAWAARRDEYRTMAGATFGEATVVECDLQHHGANDWKVYVAFVLDGLLHQESFTYRHPNEAIEAEKLQDYLKTRSAARADHVGLAGAHAAALEGLRARWAR